MIEVTFDVNSSFLQTASVEMLRELAHSLPSGRPARLAVAATVSDEGVKTADPREAYRYNRWLAERRVERVRAWLNEHVPAGVHIEPGLIEHDASRRVVITSRPAT